MQGLSQWALFIPQISSFQTTSEHCPSTRLNHSQIPNALFSDLWLFHMLFPDLKIIFPSLLKAHILKIPTHPSEANSGVYWSLKPSQLFQQT